MAERAEGDIPKLSQNLGVASTRSGFVVDPETKARDDEVVRLRIEHGLTWAKIAEHMGYADASGPYRAFQRALESVPQPAAAEARAERISYLESLRTRLLALLDEKYYTVSNGKVIFDPIKDVPLVDRAPVLAAIDRIIKIEMEIAKLQGLLNQNTMVVGAQVNYIIEGVDMDQV